MELNCRWTNNNQRVYLTTIVRAGFVTAAA